MKILLTYLKSNSFALLIAILSVLVQSFHSYTAFYNTSSLHGSAWGIAQAILFAVIIDLAILFYTLRKRTDIAYAAAFVMIVINAYYYFETWGLSWTFAFGCFLSLIIPISVYFYSEEIDEEGAPDERDRQIKTLWMDTESLVAEKLDLELKLKTMHELADKQHQYELSYKARIQDLEGDNRVKQEQIKSILESRDEAIKAYRDLEEKLNNTLADKSLLNVESDHRNDAAKYMGYNPQNTGGPRDSEL